MAATSSMVVPCDNDEKVVSSVFADNVIDSYLSSVDDSDSSIMGTSGSRILQQSKNVVDKVIQKINDDSSSPASDDRTSITKSSNLDVNVDDNNQDNINNRNEDNSVSVEKVEEVELTGKNNLDNNESSRSVENSKLNSSHQLDSVGDSDDSKSISSCSGDLHDKDVEHYRDESVNVDDVNKSVPFSGGCASDGQSSSGVISTGEYVNNSGSSLLTIDGCDSSSDSEHDDVFRNGDDHLLIVNVVNAADRYYACDMYQFDEPIKSEHIVDYGPLIGCKLSDDNNNDDSDDDSGDSRRDRCGSDSSNRDNITDYDVCNSVIEEVEETESDSLEKLNNNDDVLSTVSTIVLSPEKSESDYRDDNNVDGRDDNNDNNNKNNNGNDDISSHRDDNSDDYDDGGDNNEPRSDSDDDNVVDAREESSNMNKVGSSLDLYRRKNLDSRICSLSHTHISSNTSCPWSRNYYSTPLRPRFKLLKEGNLHICQLDRRKTILSKILNWKFLKRWEVHHLCLDNTILVSKTSICAILTRYDYNHNERWVYKTALEKRSNGFGFNEPGSFMDSPIKCTSIQDVYLVTRWDSDHKYFLRILIPNGSYLFQTSIPYSRDQWYYSLTWKKNMLRYRRIIKASTRPDIILKELVHMVEFVMSIPLQDEEITRMPISIVSSLIEGILNDTEFILEKIWLQRLISIIMPLLDNCPPTEEVCQLFSYYCKLYPKSSTITNSISLSIRHILKHNVDFGKYTYMRKLVIDYIKALDCRDNGKDSLSKFVSSVHGENYECPHPRVLTNLIAVCLSAIHTAFEGESKMKNTSENSEQKLENVSDADATTNNDTTRNNRRSDSDNDEDQVIISNNIPIEKYDCYLQILIYISTFPDWIPEMGTLLQPVPFTSSTLNSPHFMNSMSTVLENICNHPNCDGHRMILGVRKEKESWFDLYSPVNPRCQDKGHLWGIMLRKLLYCCCKRKSFIHELCDERRLEALTLLSLRNDDSAQTALCLMLEWQLVKCEDHITQITTALNSVMSGKERYQNLCRQQLSLEKFQEKCGPEKLVLPTRLIDSDFFTLMNSGSFGNLQHLCLAFTHVTSECAAILIKLPSLKVLNLWSTQFGDSGLITISEHLTDLENLNLCETRVTDDGIGSLVALKELRYLNLNSTKLSPNMLTMLQNELTNLLDIDIRYTEAWVPPLVTTQQKRAKSKS